MAEHEERAEAPGLLEQLLDVGDCVVRGTDHRAPALGVLLDERGVGQGLRAALAERDEPGAGAEVVGEVLQPVGAVLHGLLAGPGQVHLAEHPPARPVRLGPAHLCGLLLHHPPGVADRGEALRRRGHGQRQQRRPVPPGQPRPRRRDHRRHRDLGVGPLERPQLEPGLAHGEPVGLPADRLFVAEQGEYGFECLLVPPPLVGRVDAEHVGIGRQRPRPGAEDQPAAGEVVEQADPVGQQPRVVIRHRDDAGAQPDVPGALRGGRDDDLGVADQLVAAGVVLADPRLVIAEPVERLDALQVVLQRERRVLATRVEGGVEDPEVQRSHQNRTPSSARSIPARNRSSAALTSSAFSCWTQWPASGTRTVPRWSVSHSC